MFQVTISRFGGVSYISLHLCKTYLIKSKAACIQVCTTIFYEPCSIFTTDGIVEASCPQRQEKSQNLFSVMCTIGCTEISKNISEFRESNELH